MHILIAVKILGAKVLKHLEDMEANKESLGGGFKYLSFSPLPGEDSQFD